MYGVVRVIDFNNPAGTDQFLNGNSDRLHRVRKNPGTEFFFTHTGHRNKNHIGKDVLFLVAHLVEAE